MSCSCLLDMASKVSPVMSWERHAGQPAAESLSSSATSWARSKSLKLSLARMQTSLSSERPANVCRASVKKNPKRLKYAAGSRPASEVEIVAVEPSGHDAPWKLPAIAALIKEGGIGLIPTDTVYAIVCDLNNRDAVDRLYRVKNMDQKKPLSILCRTFEDIDTYTLGFPRGSGHGQTNVFRAVRQCLPGPYTFILSASKEMPKQCTTFGNSSVRHCAPRKSVGVRMPGDPTCQALLEMLDGPLLCTSATRHSEESWLLDPSAVGLNYRSPDGAVGVDFIVDGGARLPQPSTVVDFTGPSPVLLRAGRGPIEEWMVAPTQQETNDDGSLNLDTIQGRGTNPYAGTSIA